MSRRRARRSSRARTTIRDLVLLLVLCVAVGVLDIIRHYGWLILTAALIAGAFWLARRARRWHRGLKVPPAATAAPFSAIPAGPDPADQIAELERVCGRPIEAVISSYEHIQRQYRSQP